MRIMRLAAAIVEGVLNWLIVMCGCIFVLLVFALVEKHASS